MGKYVIIIIFILEVFSRLEALLMMMLRNLQEKIENLEKEKAELLVQIKKLRREAEGKALSLECEVSVLREEAETLKKMLTTL